MAFFTHNPQNISWVGLAGMTPTQLAHEVHPRIEQHPIRLDLFWSLFSVIADIPMTLDYICLLCCTAESSSSVNKTAPTCNYS